MTIIKFRLLALVFLLYFVSSCTEKEPEVAPNNNEIATEAPNSEVNSWVYDEMSDWYLWNEKLSPFSSTDSNLSPDDYFTSILYKPGEVDHFSWIQESSEELKNSLQGINKVLGLRTSWFYKDEARTELMAAINYVQKGSVAERGGLRRGQVITKVDGQPITLDNFRTVLQPNSVSLTYGTYVNGVINEEAQALTLIKETTQMQAVHHKEIIEMGNKKIGYLVYLQFITSSDQALNDTFAEFKNEGIDELVVDLRYNPGGRISSANVLGSLMVKGGSVDKVFARQVWNSKQTKRIRENFGDDALVDKFQASTSELGQLNNIPNLERVFFLVSRNSASSSELVINGIKPFMNTVLIGDNTSGKAVGSITLEDTQTPQRWKWGMQPIVLRTVNDNGTAEYGNKVGFIPDIPIEDNILPYLPFGDPEETLLSEALKEIVGEEVLAQSSSKARKVQFKAFEAADSKTYSDNPLQDVAEMYVDMPK